MSFYGKKTKRALEDKLFSDYIRRRDGYLCQLCHKQFDKNDTASLQWYHNSHYWGRANKSVRFHPDNCDGFCHKCHNRVEDEKQGEYLHYKKGQLKTAKYNELERVKNGFMKYGKVEQLEMRAILKRLWETDDEKELRKYIKDNTKKL